MVNAHQLQGVNVLVTRPEGQGDPLVAAISKAGGRAWHFPLMTISEINSPEAIDGIIEKITHLDRYQLAIFISTNAARFGLQWIDRLRDNFPQKLEVFAVGPATAEALRSLPVTVNYSDRGMDSEQMLQMQRLQDVRNQHILLFRGEGGRELLADTLRSRGAQVDYLETYRRQTPTGQEGKLVKLIARRNINVISVTSGQILDTLCQLVDIKANGIAKIPLLVPSPRVRDMALNRGFLNVFTCDGVTDEAIVASLQALVTDSNFREVLTGQE